MNKKPTYQDLEQRIKVLEEASIEAGRLQEVLQKREKKYRILVENGIDIIYRLNALGRFTFFNPVSVKLTGYSEADLIGKPFSDIIRSDCRAEAKQFYRQQVVKKPYVIEKIGRAIRDELNR